ncbi:hypothetical protein ACJQWK_07094 [Exserohilum turcicum]|uniref:Uncharacterized protein n=1 Tax=Exserohilum turcicum (strain 28A) TaxID=671987 RepID=R0JX05_EXST2|nr:uncharacterized protein SETTUDRAFT_42510 [Exserohilum turcica Et28A]EOA85473.1 hypothetical protein SETTUDRAFT_42510 [Exserohilum turcica Et28A]
MPPPPDDWKKEEWDLPLWITEDAIVPTIVTTVIPDPLPPLPQVTVPIDTASMASPTQPPSDSTRTRYRPSTRPDGYPSTLPWPPYSLGAPTPATDSWETSVSTTAVFLQTPYPETQNTAPASTADGFTATGTRAASPSPVIPHKGRPSDWGWANKGTNHAPIYAIATVVPIVLLAIIAAVALVCLRRRKRRKAAEAAAQAATQEMKKDMDEVTVQAHIAQPPSPPLSPPPPAVSVSRHYTAPPDHLPPTSTPSQFQPIILGPINPSSNGAYLTGIDTSDMVPINSGPQTLVDPFADNHSLSEPPPPYRPSSVAPPSFTTNSRPSSVRVPVSPVCPHGAERSPFDDPDDGVSILSELSFQRERFTGRQSWR